MDWPEPLLHVVGNEQGARTGELVKQVVLEAEHRGGAHNGGFRVDRTNDLLAPGLGSEELGRRVTAGIVRGNVNEPVDIVLGHSLGDSLGTVNVNVGVGKVPTAVNLTFCLQSCMHSLRGVLASDKVVDNVGVTDALLDGLGVAQIVFLWGVRERYSNVPS